MVRLTYVNGVAQAPASTGARIHWVDETMAAGNKLLNNSDILELIIQLFYR